LILRKVFVWAHIFDDNRIRYCKLASAKEYYNTEGEAIDDYEHTKNTKGWSIPNNLVLLTQYKAF